MVSMIPAFDSSTTNLMECFVVTANNDTDLESLETFTVQLPMAQVLQLLVDPANNTATITIFDMDGKTRIDIITYMQGIL